MTMGRRAGEKTLERAGPVKAPKSVLGLARVWLGSRVSFSDGTIAISCSDFDGAQCAIAMM